MELLGGEKVGWGGGWMGSEGVIWGVRGLDEE